MTKNSNGAEGDPSSEAFTVCLCFHTASCGYSSTSSSRVVNGADATLGEWPWQARLQFNNNHVCGGTLVASEWVMTAAHCMLDEDTSKFKVVIGDVDRYNKEGLEQEFKVKSIIKQPLFSHPVPYENDIALFHLSKPAKPSDAVNTACLPGFLQDVTPGDECYITGLNVISHPNIIDLIVTKRKTFKITTFC